jgi:hypothetical protein
MSISNGQDANQTTFNNAFLSRTNNSSTVGKIELDNPDTTGIAEVQRELNAIASYTGNAVNQAATIKPSWTDNSVGASGDSLFDKIEAIITLFDNISGHTHDGSPGDGGTLAALTNPMTNAGEMIYGDAGGTPAVVVAGTSGQYLKSNGTGAPTFESFVAPTVQRFTSGSGTYTTPAGVKWIRVTMVGGGGGGSGSSTIAANNGGTGGNGGNTTFGTSLLVANGGGGSALYATPGTGGTASLGTGPVGNALSGADGTNGTFQNGTGQVIGAGPTGASSPFGGAGRGGAPNGSGATAKANTGSGGGGAGTPNGSNTQSGSGGAAGGYVQAIIAAPSSTYSYAVGAGGTAGTAGTSGSGGGAGAAGLIVVEEFYQ